MNDKKAALLILLVLAAVATAQTSTVTQQQFESGTANFALEIGKSWQALAVMALIISGTIAAIGYAVGTGFEMPELKAWAGSELVQIITNAIIILVLLAVIVFLDVLVVGIVADSGLPMTCTVGQSCLQKVTQYYLNDYVGAANTTAKSVLLNNIKAAAAANRRYGGYCLSIFCLQAGYSNGVAGQKVLDQDYYAIIFEYAINLISFMEAQKFFVTEIGFKMAPVVLAIGVAARSFFFTRKIGGLLMAAAIGVMFFFPGMYIFDWLTLDFTLNGDKSMQDEGLSCPAECLITAPLAYYSDGTTVHLLNSTQDVAGAFSESNSALADAILQRTRESAPGSAGGANGRTVRSCYYGAYDGQNVYDRTKDPPVLAYANCPTACRELPYPGASPICAVPETQVACAKLPVECKVIRYIQDVDQAEYAKCPASCRVVPPLKSDCRYKSGNTIGNCLNSRFDCRMADRNNLNARPVPPQGTPDTAPAYQRTRCLQAADCPASIIATQSCVYIMPETGRCDALCPGCPAYCRLTGPVDAGHPAPLGNVNLDNLPADCKQIVGGVASLTTACRTCLTSHGSCTVGLQAINGLSPPPTACTSCPAEKRMLSSGLPPDYITGGCSLDSCPAEYRMSLPRSTCETCLSVDESYTYAPPINTKCGDLCAPSSSTPVGKAGDYMNVGATGQVGKPEIQEVAKLMLPIYVLPLFNIVATIIFIISLSGFLGGDIEIPGLSRVF